MARSVELRRLAGVEGVSSIVQALRKILRAIAIMAFFTLGCWLFVDAAVQGPGEYQLWIATVLLLGAVGLIATWFWSPLG